MGNATIQDRGARIVQELSALNDWIERYRYLIARGEELPGIDEADRSEVRPSTMDRRRRASGDGHAR